jgi:transcription antitermination factor NusG
MESFQIESSVLVNKEARWYAVHVYPQNEKKVVAELERKGIKTFLPLRGERHRWSDRNQLVQVPLFPCYAFVHIVPTPHLRAAVQQTPRVIRLLSPNGEPAPIPDSEIESIRTLLAGNVPVSPYAFLQAGQKVRIRGGCLDGLEGICVDHGGERKLVLSVNLIQQSVELSIEGYKVEPACAGAAGATG